jgi:hypothetical protein
MNMLERYLYAVERDLPKSESRGDIIAEISEELQSQIEAREAQLGRALNADEEAALIKAYGNPRVIAGRYAAVPYLIGPELLPFYWYVLRLVLSIVLGVEIVGAALLAAIARNMDLFLNGLNVAWLGLMYIFGIITIAFAVIERIKPKESPLELLGVLRWDPRDLPLPPGAGRFAPVSRFESAASFICNTMALLVLLDISLGNSLVAAFVRGMLSSASVTEELNTAAWMPAYVAAIVSTAAIAIVDVIAFFRPTITTIRLWTRIGAHTLAIAGIGLTLARPPLVLPATSPLGQVAFYTLIAAIVILGLQVAIAAWQLLRALRRTPGPLQEVSSRGTTF